MVLWTVNFTSFASKIYCLFLSVYKWKKYIWTYCDWFLYARCFHEKSNEGKYNFFYLIIHLFIHLVIYSCIFIYKISRETSSGPSLFKPDSYIWFWGTSYMTMIICELNFINVDFCICEKFMFTLCRKNINSKYIHPSILFEILHYIFVVAWKFTVWHFGKIYYMYFEFTDFT